MPSKRGKSGTASGAAEEVDSNVRAWETGLSAATFDEASWRADISFVVGENLEDEKHIVALLTAAQLPLRKLFSVISLEGTVEKINDLGNPKVKKTKDVPMFYEVTEVAKSIMDAGEEVPTDLMGKLVKFQLLAIKNMDLQRRAAEEKAAEVKLKGKVGGNSPTRDKGSAKAPGKGDKGKKATEAAAPAKDTKLKRRGEEDDTNKYIDDEPDDGPQHYILVVGFHQPRLILALSTLGIHVSNIIKLSSDRREKPVVVQEAVEVESQHELSDAEAELVAMRKQKELDHFWEHLEVVLKSGSANAKLSDVARLSYRVNDTILPSDTDDAEAMLAFGTQVFEDTACLIYDCLDWRKQHQNYLNCMRLLQVPVLPVHSQCSLETAVEVLQTQTPQTPKKKQVSEDIPAEPEVPALTTRVDMRHYDDLMEQIPLEVTSVPLILHCMLEQVVASEQDGLPQGLRDSGLGDKEAEHDLASCLLSAISVLPRSKEDKEKLKQALGVVDDKENKSAPKHPLLINVHDDRTRRMLQVPVLNGFDAEKVETDLMNVNPVWSHLQSLHNQRTNIKLARDHELRHYCTDESLSRSELQHLLLLCIFESMPLTGVDENGRLMATVPENPSNIPWADPVSFAKHLFASSSSTKDDESLSSQTACEDQEKRGSACKITIADLRKTLIRKLEDWSVTEHHNASVFPQVVQAASEMYRCMNTFCCKQDSDVFVVFHNPMNHQRSCSDSWNAAIHTDVGFRNYLEHVADSIRDWTIQEEMRQDLQKKMEAERLSAKNKSEPLQSSDSPVQSPIPDVYIREDSLKAWKIEQERLREEELLKKVKKEKSGKAARVESDSAKESKKTSVATRKSPTNVSKTPDAAGALTDATSGPRSFEDLSPSFTGYRMDGKLIQVSGTVQSLFPSDGGHILIERIQFVQGSTQVKVCVMKNNHHFYIHILEEIRDMEDNQKDKEDTSLAMRTARCGSFCAVLNSGIRISYSLDRTAVASVASSLSSVRSEQPLAGDFTATPTDPKGSDPDPLLPDPDPPLPSAAQEKLGSEAAIEAGLSVAPCESLSMAIPSGLVVHFLYEPVSGGKKPSLLVRQTFPHARSGSAPPQGFLLSTELSRVITTDGTVIKQMKDGSTVVLFADGTVCRSPDPGPAEPEERVKNQTPEEKEPKDRKGKHNSKMSVAPEPADSGPKEEQKSRPIAVRSWTTTTPSGHRVASVGDEMIEAPPILTYQATDPFSKTVVLTREDKVLSVLETDGTMTVDHADGTRITTFYQERELQGQLGAKTSNEPSWRERQVRVECVGFATVIVSCDDGAASVCLGDGSVISASGHGSYEISPSGGGLLHIHERGNAVFTSVPTTSVGGQPTRYEMNPSAHVVCQVTDQEGNLSQVTADGQAYMIASAATAANAEGENSLLKDRTASEAHLSSEPTHCRLFIAHEDGSGTELLCWKNVEEQLSEAYSDPTVAVLKEPLPHSRDVFGITVLKPCPPNVWSSWLIPKQNDDIIPTHLKSRKWEDFPSTECRIPGPPFGTTLGPGLSVKARGFKPASPIGPPVPQCPDVLLCRQLIQYQPLTDQLREDLQTRLMNYIVELLRREQLMKDRQVKDPRTAEERVHESDLLKLVLSFSGSDPLSDNMEKTSIPEELVSSYTQAVTSALHPETVLVKKESEMVNDRERSGSRWGSRIKQRREELEEERKNRDAIRNHHVPPYFQSELERTLQLP